MPRTLPVFFWDIPIPDEPPTVNTEPEPLPRVEPQPPPQYDLPALPAGPAPTESWETRAADLNRRIPIDTDLNRRSAVFDFMQNTDWPRPVQDIWLGAYNNELSSGRDVNAWLRDNAGLDWAGNASRTQDNLGLSAGLGFAFGGPIGAIAAPIVDIFTTAAVNEELGGAPPWLQTAAAMTPGFVLPGRAFGGGLSVRQRIAGIAGSTLGAELGTEYGGEYGAFAGGLVGGFGGTLAAPSPGARRAARTSIDQALNDAELVSGPRYDLNEVDNYLETGISHERVTPKVRREFIESENKMYSGPIDQVGAKELFQNSIDASRETGGTIRLDYDTNSRRLVIRDTGRGMSYDVLTHEYIEPGGSFKGDVESTGKFGRAKIALFGDAETVHTTTTTRAPDGRFISSELTGGDMYSMLTEGVEAKVTHRTSTGRTGTTVELTLKPTSRRDPNVTQRWISNLLGRSRLPAHVKLAAMIDGETVTPVDVPSYDHIGRFIASDGGAEVMVFAATTNRMGQNVTVHYLNNGMYQFSDEAGSWGGGVKIADSDTALPTDLVVDVKSLVPANDPAYPWNLEREGLAGAVRGDFQDYVVRDLQRAAAAANREFLSAALRSATGTGTGHTLVDFTGQLDPQWLRDMARKPYLAALVAKLDEYTAKWHAAFKAKYSGADDVVFNGWSTNPGHLGAHIYSDVIFGGGRRLRTEAQINADISYKRYELDTGNPTPERRRILEQGLEDLAEEQRIRAAGLAPNPIVLNPWIIMREAMTYVGPGASNRILAEAVGEQIAGTLLHETVHSRFRSHGYMSYGAADFGRAYEDLFTHSSDLFSSTKNAFKHILYTADLDAWKADLDDYDNRIRELGDPERNVFVRASDDDPTAGSRGDQGLAGRGREFRARLAERLQTRGADLQSDVQSGSPVAAGSHTRPGAYPGAPGPYAPSRTIDLPDAVATQLNTHAESVRQSTGAYPPGDPPVIGAWSGGAGTRNGNGALANFSAVLNALDEIDGLDEYVAMGEMRAPREMNLAELKTEFKRLREQFDPGIPMASLGVHDYRYRVATKQSLLEDIAALHKAYEREFGTGIEPMMGEMRVNKISQTIGRLARQEGSAEQALVYAYDERLTKRLADKYRHERKIDMEEFRQEIEKSHKSLFQSLKEGSTEGLWRAVRATQELIDTHSERESRATRGSHEFISQRAQRLSLERYLDQVLGELRDRGELGAVMGEMRHNISPAESRFDIRDFPTGTANIDVVRRTTPQGKVTRRREIITELTEAQAEGGTRASSQQQLRESGAMVLDRWAGAQKNYYNDLDISVRDFHDRLRADKAADKVFRDIPESLRPMLMEYDTIGDMHPSLIAKVDTILPGFAAYPPNTPLKDFVAPALHPYIDEMRAWRRDVEARDTNHNPDMARIDEDFDYWPGVFKPLRGKGRGRRQPGTRQGFEIPRNRVIEDPITGELRAVRDAAELADARPRSVSEAVLLFGEELVSDSWADQMRVRDFAGYQRIQADLMLQRMKASGLAVIARGFGVSPHAVTHPGWRVPDVAGWKEKLVPHTAGEGAPSVYGYQVPETIARQLENAFDVHPDVFIRPQLSMANKLITQLKLLGFIGSGFQHLDIITRGMAVKTGLHFGKGRNIFEILGNTAGIPLGHLNVIGESVYAAINPGYRKALQEEFTGARAGADPRLRQVTAAGGNALAVQGLVSGYQVRLGEDLKRFPILGGAVDLPIGPVRVIPWALNHFASYMSGGLFDGVYPAVYKHVALDMWDSIKAKNPSWTNERIASVVAENTNLMLGSVATWRSVTQNEGFRDMLRAFLISIGDPESVMRGDARALSSLTGIGRGRVSAVGRAAGMDWARIRVGHLLTMFTFANVINYAVTGQLLTPDQFSPFVWDDDEKRPKFNTRFMRPVIGFTENGAPIFVDLFGQMDTSLRLISPDTFLNNRLNQSARFAKGWLTNSTYEGLKAGNARETYRFMWEKTKALGYEAIAPISYKNLREGFEAAKGNFAVIGAELLGSNIFTGSLNDFERQTAEQLYVYDHTDPETGRRVFRERGAGEAKYKPSYDINPLNIGRGGNVLVPSRDRPNLFDELSPAQQQRIRDLPQYKALQDKQQEFFEKRGDTFSTTVETLKARTDAEIQAAEDFYRSGGYLRNPNEPTLPEKLSDLATKRRNQHEAISEAFAKTIAGFDKKKLDANADTYFGILERSGDPQDKATVINWPETLRKRDEFLNGLPALERRDIDEYLAIIEGNRTPLWREFRRDMDTLRESNYPFGTAAATNFQTRNPNADLAMWKWYGGALNSIEAIDKALEVQQQYPQPIHLAGYGHRIDTDLEQWRKDSKSIGLYLGLTTQQRNQVLEAVPTLNARLVYWGNDVSFRTTDALNAFDQMMRQSNWAPWQDPEVRRRLIVYFAQNDTNRRTIRREVPRVDALVNLFNEHQYGRAPIFWSDESKQLYQQYNPGRDVSALPVSPPLR